MSVGVMDPSAWLGAGFLLNTKTKKTLKQILGTQFLAQPTAIAGW
jgi:hypothetical protein